MDDPEQDPLRLVGTVLEGKYQIEQWIAEGGFSYVYRAQHLLWHQPVAIKVLKILGTIRSELRDDLLKSFVQEGSLLRELSSRTASILQAHDLGSWTTPKGDWYPYLVLEWLEGEALDDILFHEQTIGTPVWTLHECMQLLEPAANALAVVHRKGITHRDLKPANLFVLGPARSAEAFVKVLDFGIAKVVQDVAQLTASSAKTGTGFSSFTPQYGAPEQFSRVKYGATGPWTDVYAFALILVEMMTFTPPLDGEDVAQLAFSSTDASRRPTPRQRGAAVTDAVEAVFEKALALQTTDRFATLGEFWNALTVAVGRTPLQSGTAGSATPVERRPVIATTLPALEATPPVLNEFYTAKTTPPSLPPMAEAHGGRRTARVAGVIAAMALFGAGVSYAILSRRPPAKLAPAEVKVTPVAPTAQCPSNMASISGGQFFMGYDGEKAFDFERPIFPVIVSPFCVDVTEVTVEAYKACSNQGRCARAHAVVSWPNITAHDKTVYSPLCNVDQPGRDRHPINCVDWDMASTYCAAQGKRLLTSAEWEYAVRGPDGRIYPWGDEPPDANHLNGCGAECVKWGKEHGETLMAMYTADDGFPNTAPVGSFPRGRSRYGLDDVIGNVMEWVYDWDGPYSKSDHPLLDPKGPSAGTERVIRGGAWNAGSSAWVRPSFRFRFPPETRSHAVGIRCGANPK